MLARRLRDAATADGSRQTVAGMASISSSRHAAALGDPPPRLRAPRRKGWRTGVELDHSARADRRLDLGGSAREQAEPDIASRAGDDGRMMSWPRSEPASAVLSSVPGTMQAAS